MGVQMKHNYCPGCGEKLKEESKFCHNCGFKLGREPVLQKTNIVMVTLFLFIVLGVFMVFEYTEGSDITGMAVSNETEPYTVKVPYETKVPFYCDCDCEYELRYSAGDYFIEEKWDPDRGHYTRIWTDLTNTDTDGGYFELVCMVNSESDGKSVLEDRKYIKPNQTKTMECLYDNEEGEEFSYKMEIVPDKITKHRTETRYRTRTEYRTYEK